MGRLVKKYFPEISSPQEQMFDALTPLYRDWNSKINVISRKDIDNFELHHLLHSLAIARVIKFTEGTTILDVGTGGGFPGIPLAIMFPGTNFTLVDSIKKKTVVVDAVVNELGLTNVKVICARAEDITQKFDFVISRAVTAFPRFVEWTAARILTGGENDIVNGILYLKGGDLTDELAGYLGQVKIFDLENFFEEDFFIGKKVVYLPV